MARSTGNRSIEDAPDSVLMTVNRACASLVAQANLSLKTEPPAPPPLVQAGVRAGYDSDLSTWSGPAIELAVEETRAFEGELRQRTPEKEVA